MGGVSFSACAGEGAPDFHANLSLTPASFCGKKCLLFLTKIKPCDVKGVCHGGGRFKSAAYSTQATHSALCSGEKAHFSAHGFA